MSVKAVAVIAGVGPGTGSFVARRFAQSYPVALLARNAENYEPLVQEINSKGGKAIGISTDVSNEESIRSAIETIAREHPDAPYAAAIFNASGAFMRKPFLETTLEDLEKSWEVTVKGAFLFSQATLPLLLKHAEDKSAEHPPTLIFTGATASVKANAQMASFAAPKWALRAMSTSLAKEFAPQGVHVAHAVIDGIIDIPRTQGMLKDAAWEAKLGPEDIAKTYWDLHTQSRRGFTNEVDLRPMMEKW